MLFNWIIPSSSLLSSPLLSSPLLFLRYALEFTDPTNACKFGEPGAPLNEWVLLPPRGARGVQHPATAPL